MKKYRRLCTTILTINTVISYAIVAQVLKYQNKRENRFPTTWMWEEIKIFWRSLLPEAKLFYPSQVKIQTLQRIETNCFWNTIRL